jgi:hypothetical protein
MLAELPEQASFYDELALQDGVDAANAACGLINYFVRLVHVSDKETEMEMSYWTGTVANVRKLK